MSSVNLVRGVLDFWFGMPASAEFGTRREAWFRKDPAFDEAIRRQFAEDVAAAAKGEHDRLLGDAEGALALAILLDQFPRNLYRGQAKTYAADPKARAVAGAAIDRGFAPRSHRDSGSSPTSGSCLPKRPP